MVSFELRGPANYSVGTLTCSAGPVPLWPAPGVWSVGDANDATTSHAVLSANHFPSCFHFTACKNQNDLLPSWDSYTYSLIL
jgi:hypothetical protein